MKNAIFIPIVSEKSVQFVAKDKYSFKIPKNYNKLSVMEEIEKKYKVNILKINLIRKKGKIKNFKGKKSGKTQDWKLAIITVKKGQKIPGFEIAEDKK